MLQLLRQCKHWYMDSTFKALIKEPFGQLFAIHGFVRSGDNLKQLLRSHVASASEEVRLRDSTRGGPETGAAAGELVGV